MIITSLASSSAGNCYIVESGGERLLIECGISFRKIQEGLEFDFSNIVACLVSHAHKDHCYAADDIMLKTGVKILCPENFHHGKHGDHFPFSTRQFIVRHVMMAHDIECWGYLIRNRSNLLFYATDTGALPYQIPGLTHLMIEANYSTELLLQSELPQSVIDHIVAGHLSIEAAIEFAARHRRILKQIHLIHLSDEHSDAVEFERLMSDAIGVPVYVADR